MENKEIIIDGVDVSGCNFTIERDGKIKCECTHATGFGVICDCESWKTCDYKNYKRKEQECEELERLYKELQDDMLACNKCRTTIKLQQQLDQIKAENEILEAHSSTLDAVIETGRVQYKALKQTLIEIKEIIKQGVKIHDDIIVSKQILQKINEVIE